SARQARQQALPEVRDRVSDAGVCPALACKLSREAEGRTTNRRVVSYLKLAESHRQECLAGGPLRRRSFHPFLRGRRAESVLHNRRWRVGEHAWARRTYVLDEATHCYC